MPLANRQRRSPEPAPLRAVVWLRVSTAEQAEEGRAGLPRQRQNALRVAASKGYEVVTTIELVDVSGTSTALAPEMQNLLGMVERQEIQIVVVSEMSRLLRPDDLSSLAVLDSFKRAGVLIDVGGSVVDLSQPEGFLTGGIQAILGGHERMQMLRKMMQSKEERRRMGKCPGSAITLPTGIGYEREKDEWTTTDEIWRVQEAFRLIDEEGLRNIAEVGRRIGILCSATMGNLLRNPIFKGLRIIDEKRDTSVKHTKADGRQGDRPKIKRREDEIIRVRVFPEGQEPVPPERWERVNEVLLEISMAHKLKRERNARVHLLSGIGRCGFCGERLYTKKKAAKTGQVGHYICACRHESRKGKLPMCAQPWLRMIETEELALAFAREVLSWEDLVSDIIGESERRKHEKLASFPLGGPDAAKQLAGVRRREERLLEAYEGGALSLDELKDRKAKLAQERSRIAKAAEAAKQHEGRQDVCTETARRVAEGARALDAAKTDAERKRVMQSVFSEIYFEGYSITAFTLAPALLPKDGGNSFPGIAGVVSLNEPFRLVEPEEPVPEGMKRCTGCRKIKELDEFYKRRRDAGDGVENRVPRCSECHRAEYARKRER